MNRGVVWTERALKDVAKLDKQTRKRIFDAVDRMVETGYGDIARLHGTNEKIFRLRVGNWRVFFSPAKNLRVVIRRVRPRGGAYQT